ncbi:MAG: SET domain-containing protein-lysine N-methyltransferase [Xanthomonadales bacterium]|nr:SET domain-containing protein-lysine N-methyltransferase [Xanthomonadales bacterium]
MSDFDSNPLCLVADSPVHGRGLFARQDIPAGTWIGHYGGEETQENGMHVLWLAAEEGARDQWTGYDGNNELRFLNHAKQPNGEMDELDLYAASDISAGEEITIDYGEEFTTDA